MTTQIKGLAVAGTVTRIKEKYGGDTFQRILNEMNEEDQKIMGGNLLPSVWYSLDTFSNFLNAEVKVLYGGDASKLQLGSAEIVSKQLKGIYKFFVKLGSPEFIIGRISSIHNSYFNGIALEKEINDGEFVGRYTGYKSGQAVFEEVIIGFYKKALELSGAKNIEAKFDVPIDSGNDFAQITVSWTK